MELLLWCGLIFFLGCMAGYLARDAGPAGKEAGEGTDMSGFGWQCSPVERAGTEAPLERGAGPAAAKTMAPVAQSVAAKPAAAPKPAAKPASGKPVRPKGLSAARGGKPDNLQMISGVGPKLEKTLQGLGFYHFDQIAGWSQDEVDWVDEHLRFKGRIDRDEWIPQSRLLAAGDIDAFAKKYGSGGTKSGAAKKRSGPRARK